jgi:hypothetical protein
MNQSGHRKKISGMTLLLCPLILLLGGCGASGVAPGVYGPAYVPECTCCCGGGYTPYAYKQSNHSSISGPPVATSFLHDTKGPMADVSANGKSQAKRTKTAHH